ncbi:PIG-L family deacetylase [Bacteroidota bacterium]
MLKLIKLNVLGSVLYLAAHPDDENSALLAYLSKGILLRTGYMSLNRGDGGQNLIGNEKGDLLGVVRTQESLSAREIDGAEQFFTRAVDFGYSKSSEETLNFWNNELVLGDIVKIIRQYRPDIIITRFSKTDGRHGHHLASAILAEEAFHAAADPNKFPEQLEELNTWQAKRLIWNTWKPDSNSIGIDLGEYNALLGKSYFEIMAESRSMHKTQGFGFSPKRGNRIDYYDYFAGDSASSNIFEDIDLTWTRIPDGKKIQDLVNSTIDKFDVEHPDKSVDDLIEIYNKLAMMGDNYWINIKIEEVKELIKLCSGLWLGSYSSKSYSLQSKSIDITSSIINRSDISVTIDKISTTYANVDSTLNRRLEKNKLFTKKQSIKIPADADYSQPYWLVSKHNGKIFEVNDTENIGLPKNKPELVTTFHVNINGLLIQYEEPVIYNWNDAVKGEQFSPFTIQPELSLKIYKSTYVFPNNDSKIIYTEIEANENNLEGKIYLSVPEGWKVEQDHFLFNLVNRGDKQTYAFNISPAPKALDGKVLLRAESNGKLFNQEIIKIEYSHIKPQVVLQQAKSKLIKLDINIVDKKVGYIMGSGDNIPDALTELGYKVDLLSDDDLDNMDLSIYDVIICGVRAFNARPRLTEQQNRLNKFVSDGGTWIVQHNTRFGNRTAQIGPYKFAANGSERISEEDADLVILKPEHPVFNFPNKISSDDFNGWVQERGLYFANEFDENMTPLLTGHDKNEPGRIGGLLYSAFGKGVFIYTGLSFFRQLPAGVPGAYRLFVNMISIKGE